MILVTGGTGLIGSHLIVELLKQNRQVTAIKRPSSDITVLDKVCSYYGVKLQTLPGKLQWIDFEMDQPDGLADVINGAETVFHCAAVVSFNPERQQEMLHFNIQSTANLVNACLGKENLFFCHVSSIAALGMTEKGNLTDENCKWIDNKGKSAYALSKYLSEMEVWRGMQEGLHAVIVNPSVVLGPGNWESGASAAFRKIYQGFKYYTGGSTGFVDVRDVVMAMIQLSSNKIGGERVILNAANISYQQLFTYIAASLHVSPPRFKAWPWILKLAVLAEKIKSQVMKNEPLITRDTARSAWSNSQYSNAKALDLGIQFRNLDDTLQWISELYVKSIKQ